MEQLSPDLLYYITTFLKLESILQLRGTCRRFRNLKEEKFRLKRIERCLTESNFIEKVATIGDDLETYRLIEEFHDDGEDIYSEDLAFALLHGATDCINYLWSRVIHPSQEVIEKMEEEILRNNRRHDNPVKDTRILELLRGSGYKLTPVILARLCLSIEQKFSLFATFSNEEMMQYIDISENYAYDPEFLVYLIEHNFCNLKNNLGVKIGIMTSMVMGPDTPYNRSRYTKAESLLLPYGIKYIYPDVIKNDSLSPFLSEFSFLNQHPDFEKLLSSGSDDIIVIFEKIWSLFPEDRIKIYSILTRSLFFRSSRIINFILNDNPPKIELTEAIDYIYNSRLSNESRHSLIRKFWHSDHHFFDHLLDKSFDDIDSTIWYDFTQLKIAIPVTYAQIKDCFSKINLISCAAYTIDVIRYFAIIQLKDFFDMLVECNVSYIFLYVAYLYGARPSSYLIEAARSIVLETYDGSVLQYLKYRTLITKEKDLEKKKVLEELFDQWHYVG